MAYINFLCFNFILNLILIFLSKNICNVMKDFIKFRTRTESIEIDSYSVDVIWQDIVLEI